MHSAHFTVCFNTAYKHVLAFFNSIYCGVFFLQNKQIPVKVRRVRTGPAVILKTKLISSASVQMVLWEIPAMSKATKLPLSLSDKHVHI